MQLPRKLVVDEYGLPFAGSEEHEVEVLDDQITGNSRWSVWHLLTVRIKDKFYQTKYCVGATEYQDERPWQDDAVVNFTEVVKRQITVDVWVRASKV